MTTLIRSLFSLTLAGALLLCAAPLAAQEQEPPTPEEEAAAEDLPRVDDVLVVEESIPYVPTSNTIATKLTLPLQRTPSSVGVVAEPLFSEQGGLVLGDALRNVSGVNLHTQSGIADVFWLRGFDSLSGGLVLTDGAAEPEVAFYQLYNVERVEVLKGPGGFLYGANPLAGVVNLVRKQPQPASFLRVGGSAGSFETSESSLDWNGASRDGALSFRLNGFFEDTAGYRDDIDGRAAAVNPAFTWRPGESTTLNVNAEYVDADFSPDAGLPVLRTATGGFELAPVPRRRSYQSPYDRSNQEIGRLQVDYETMVNDRLSLRNKAYYRSLDWRSDGTLFNGVFPTATGALEVSRSLLLLDDRQEFLGNQLEALVALETGTVTHELLAGIEAGRLTDRFTLDVGLLPGIDLFSPVETAAGPVFLIPGQSAVGDAESTVIAPYLVDQITFTERFQAVVGARFDSIDYEDAATGTSRDDSQLSPMLGLVYSPVPDFSLYANLTRAFAPPSPRVVGERQPEESEQAEVGAKTGLLGGKVLATLALYQLDRENVAIPDDNGFTQQTGSQRSRGVELELAAEPLPRLRTFFSYAYNNAELTRFAERVLVGFFPPTFATVDRSGNVPAFAPEHIANLWVSRRFDSGLGLGAGARYLAEQYIAEDNGFALDSSLTLDAALHYDLGDWRLNLNLKNLTDEEYETRGFGSTSVIPANGFAVYGGFEYRLALR